MGSAARFPIAATIVAGAALLWYGFAVEPSRVTVNTLTIRSAGLAATLAGRKAAVLSDLHFRSDGEPAAETALRLLESLKPDVIFLAGDYVAWGERDAAYENALQFLSRLEAPLGVFAVLGEADSTYSRKSCEYCHAPGSGAPTSRHGVTFLRDREASIVTPEGAVRILGLDSRPGEAFLRSIQRRLRDDEPTIILAHASAVYNEIAPDREVLVLSGDTHGGQIWLPGWVWRLLRVKPDPGHLSGLFAAGRKRLLVTRGIGTSHLRFRLGSPPEIAVLEFVR